MTAVAVFSAGCGGDDSGGGEAAASGSPVEAADLQGQDEDDGAESSAVEREREAVIDAHWAAMEARIASAAAPEPDPYLPELEQTHTDPRLSEWVERLHGLAVDDLAIRYPEDSQLEVVEVIDVTFGWWEDDEGSAATPDAGPDEVGDKATLDVCILDDGETYEVGSGDVRGSGLYTIRETATMRRIDGVWKLADYTATSREGRTGCAAE